MPYVPEPLTESEQERYNNLTVGSNAHHASHGTGVVVAKDEKFTTVEFASSATSSFGNRGWRSLIENENEVEIETSVNDKPHVMSIKVPAKAIADEYGSWKITDEFGGDLLKKVTKYLKSQPTFVELNDISKPMETGSFSRRIKELRSIDYNNTESLIEHLAGALDYSAFTWAREISKSTADVQDSAYQTALKHLGKDAWRSIFHVHERNTDSERRAIEKMLLNITNKSVDDISDYQARREAALEIAKAIETRTAAMLKAYLVDAADVANQEAQILAAELESQSKPAVKESVYS